MKPFPAALAGLLAAFLLLSPLAMAATPTVSVTPSAVTTGQTVTITGTTTASASVGLKVTNPSGAPVFIDNVVASAGGAFTDSFVAGGSTSWTTGIYLVSATVASQTGTATFGYTATGTTGGFNETQAYITLQNDLKGNFTIISGDFARLQADLNGNFSAIKSTQASQGSTLTAIQSALSTLTGDVTSLSSSVSSI